MRDKSLSKRGSTCLSSASEPKLPLRYLFHPKTNSTFTSGLAHPPEIFPQPLGTLAPPRFRGPSCSRWAAGPPPACLCMSSLCVYRQKIRCDHHRVITTDTVLCVWWGASRDRVYGVRSARAMSLYLKYLSPAKAGRLLTEGDGGEEAGRRRGAVVSAALHLPV